jgi:multiple sugar transport system substrate-binding protein
MTFRMRLNRRAALTGSIGAGALLLAACASATPTAAPPKPAAEAPKPAQPAAAATKPAEAPKPVQPAAAATKPADPPKPAAAAAGKPSAKIQFWFNGGRVWEDFFTKTFLPKFYQDRPGVEVELTTLASWDDQYNKLVTAAAGGSPPASARNKDFWTPDFAARGVYEPLDSYLAKQTDITPEKYLKGAWATSQWEGKTVALPLHVFVRGIRVNDELFQKAGLVGSDGKPKIPDTWQEMTDAAQKISKPDENIWGTMLYNYSANEDGVNHFNYLLTAAGGRLMSDDRSKFTFNSPEGIETLEYIVGQLKSKAALPAGTPTTQVVESGRVGIWWGSAFDWPGLERNAPKVKFTESVAPKNKNRGGIIRGNHMPIFRENKNKDAAWSFVSWLQIPENAYIYAQTANYLMPRLDLKDKPLYSSTENWKQVSKQFYDPDNQPQPMFPGYVESCAKIGNHFVEAYLGKKAPKQALADAERDALDVLKQFRR